jgi:hypothetical protein
MTPDSSWLDEIGCRSVTTRKLPSGETSIPPSFVPTDQLASRLPVAEL